MAYQSQEGANVLLYLKYEKLVETSENRALGMVSRSKFNKKDK